MSMILEALRKSEAERRRGRAPGLFVEHAPARGYERRVPGWAFALGALLVAVLLAWAWREWQRPARVLVTTAEPAADTVTQAQSTQIATRVEPAPGEPGWLAPMTLEPGTPTLPVASAPAATTVEPMPAPAPAPAPASARAAAPAPTPATAPAATAPAQPEAIRAPAPAPAAPLDPVASLPGLDALPAADRSALPPLKLSMHVYAETPAQRFVILDGQRLGEGASPASGVVLEEIRREGLVLSVNGRRLLLARP